MRVALATARRLASVRFLMFTIACLAFGLVSGSDQSSAHFIDAGVENSWIRIQNVGVQAATAEVAFYNLGGDPVTTDRCPTSDRCASIPPGQGWSFFQEGFQALEPGFRGSAFLNIDQPFVAMLAKDIFRGNDFEIGGDTLRLGGGAPTQYAPFVQRTDAEASRITVQNTSSSEDACFEITYFAAGSGVATAVDPPGPTSGCPNGGQLVRSRASWVRDFEQLPVPMGFEGSAVIRSKATGSGVRGEGQAPMAIVDTHRRFGSGLASSRTLGGDELSRVVVLPLADRNATEGQSTWSTRFRVVSAEPAAANAVTLLYEGDDGGGGRIEIEHSLSITGALTCDLRLPNAGGCLPPDRSLPEHFRGSVRMQGIEPIAVIAQRVSDDGRLGDYRGFTPEEASRQVVLPVVNRNYGPWGGSSGWNSWFRVLTFDGSEAHVRVVYYSKRFPQGLFAEPVIVDRERTFRQWDEGQLPDGWVGSAVIVSDQPVVVVANLESDVFSGDGVMMYNGVSLE